MAGVALPIGSLSRFSGRIFSLSRSIVAALNPFDTLTFAALYSSARRLRTQYTGPLLRVRRSSDNAELDIGSATTVQTRTNLAPVPANNLSGFSQAGITMTNVGSGTEFGQSYVDVRFSGTASGVGTQVYSHSLAPVTPGVTYTASIGYRFVGGTPFTGTTGLRHVWRSSTGSFVNQSAATVPAPTADLQRRAAIGVAPAGTSYTQAGMTFAVNAGDVVDFTVRFYAPNVEEGTGNARPLVQRNVPETIADVGDLDAEALLAHVGAGTGFVTTWYDQSGNARDMAQATAANQPSIVRLGAINTVNGRPALQFDGVDDTMATPSLASLVQNTAPFTIMDVVNVLTGSTGRLFDNFSNPSGLEPFHSLGVNANNQLFAQRRIVLSSDSKIITGSSIATNSLNVATHIFNGLNSSIHLNGGLEVNGDLNTSALTSSVTNADIGAMQRSILTGPTLMFFSEKIFFTSALSTTDRQTLERNQGTYYGIAIT